MKQWNIITTEEDVYALIEKSIERPQIIFKDSVTCGISQYAKERLTLGFDLIAEKADFNYLDLLSYRPISNLIAQVLGVTHQSPQIIILKDKKVVQMYSHHSIEPKKIATHLE
jgi:bacillithiol system protein YtxJ